MKTIFCDSKTNEEIAVADVPQGWQKHCELDTSTYFGCLNPIGYSLRAFTEDDTVVVSYASAANYSSPAVPLQRDSDVCLSKNNKSLLFNFREAGQCCEEMMSRNFPNSKKITFAAVLSPKEGETAAAKENEERYRQRIENAFNSAKDKKRILTDVYYDNSIRAYDIETEDGGLLRAAARLVVRAFGFYIEENGKKSEKMLNWDIIHSSAYWAPKELFEKYYPCFLTFDASVAPADHYNKLLSDAIKELNAPAGTQAAAAQILLAKDDNGVSYGKIKAPAGWSASAKRNDKYSGYGYPFNFTISAASADNSAFLYYMSPRKYNDDLTSSSGGWGNFRADDCGNLLGKFMGVEEYLDAFAFGDLKECNDVKFVKQLPPPFAQNAEYAKAAEEDFTQTQKKYGKDYPDRVLLMSYFKAAVRVYRYSRNNATRMRAYCALVDAKEYKEYTDPQIPQYLLNDPYMRNVVGNVFPELQPGTSGRMQFCSSHDRPWFVNNITCLDAKEADFDALFEEAYVSFANYGVVWQTAIFDEMKAQQAKIDQRNRAVREDRAQADRIRRKMEEDKRAAEQERFDILRKSNEDISRITRESYENRQRAQDKANRQWSDSFRGDKRYTDRYNDEYVVHGTGRYAYKRGDTVISTDDPYSPGFDWEELK